MTYQRTCTIKILDEVNCVLDGLLPDHVGYFYEEYSKYAPNYHFNPKFTLGSWNGKIQYFHKTGKTYVNLLDTIIPTVIGLKYKIDIKDQRSTVGVNPVAIDKDFFKHIANPETGEPWEIRDYQVEMVNALIEAGNGVGICGTGGGKALSMDAKVLTPTGWKLNGDLIPGDEVITPAGNVSKILGVFPQGKKELFEVTFHDGAKVKCCADHLWETRFPKQPYRAWTETRIVNTREIISFLERKKSGRVHTPGNISIPLISPIEYPEQKHKLDPYALGLLLGDGCFQKTTLFSSEDDDLLIKLEESVSNFGVKLKYRGKCDYGIVKQEPQNSRPPSPNKLREEIERLHLGECRSHTKFIPPEYKVGSSEQRFEIIRGLFDTDGTSDSRGIISFTSVSKTLAKDVQEIIWSLGGTCTITSRIPTYTYNGNKSEGQLAYTCHVRHPTPCKFFWLPRKKQLTKDVHADGRIELTRRIVDITPVGVDYAQCILIDDPHHLYITNDYIVTHNTSMTAALALSYEAAADCRSIIIVPDKNLSDQTRDEYAFFGLDVGEYSGERKDIKHKHVVSTWQALQNNPSIIKDFDVVVVDECFAGDTKITMSNGTSKEIIDVLPGDEIISYNVEKQKFETDIVVKQHKNLKKSTQEEMYELEFDNGVTIHVTGNHKILTQTGYIRADELTEEDEIMYNFNGKM